MKRRKASILDAPTASVIGLIWFVNGIALLVSGRPTGGALSLIMGVSLLSFGEWRSWR